MNLEKRIRALEARTISQPVILHFADGSTRQISGPRAFMLKLWAGLSGEELSPVQAEQFDLIRRCTFAEEPGGGRLIEMLKALMEPADPLEGSS